VLCCEADLVSAGSPSFPFLDSSDGSLFEPCLTAPNLGGASWALDAGRGGGCHDPLLLCGWPKYRKSVFFNNGMNSLLSYHDVFVLCDPALLTVF
jgi:hypothetical protein